MGTEQDRREYLNEFNPQKELQVWCRKNPPYAIYNKLTSVVFGQDEACKTIATLVHGFLHSVSCHYEKHMPMHFFICGRSGCGKTHIIKCLQTHCGLQIPIHIVDASSITAAGYKGSNISEILEEDENDKMWQSCRIIVFDEMDKLIAPSTSAEGDSYGERLMSNFLKIMDSGEIKGKETIDLSRTLFIFLGAFDYPEIRQPNKGKVEKHIGFGADIAEKEEEYKEEITIDDIAKFSGNYQFASRILHVVNLKRVDDSVYKKIISSAEQEVKRVYGSIADGFFLSKADYEEIIADAKARDGCRIIRQMVWDRFLTSDYSLRRVRRGGIYDIESGKRSCDDILGEYFEKEKYLAEK